MLDVRRSRRTLAHALFLVLVALCTTLGVGQAAAAGTCDRAGGFPTRLARDIAGCRLLSTTVNAASHNDAARPQASVPRSVLTSSNFKLVAQHGFGDLANSYAYSSAYVHGRVYVGTGRYLYCSSYTSTGHYPPDPTKLIPCPPTEAALYPQMAAQIVSVDPSNTLPITQSNWTLNYAAPLTVPMPVSGTTVMGPVDFGFRGMSVYRDPQSHTQTLYASGLGPGFATTPPTLVGSSDGQTFQAVPHDPGTTMGDLNMLTTTVSKHNAGMRAQAQLGNTLYVAVTGVQGGGTLFASPTPALGNNSFQQITPQTMVVWEVMAYNGHLYIGLANQQGYGVVRTDCTAPPAGQVTCPAAAFTTVIPFGAGIPQNPNNDVESLAVYTDTLGVSHLYVGAGVSPSTNSHAAELTRINPDDSWDVIVGRSRIVNGIVKPPLSRLGEGFGFNLNKYMWRMAVYKGALYVGTWNTATITYVNTPQWTTYQSTIGCNLWGSSDGIAFQAVTRNGFGDPYCEGIRTMIGTPYGLFVGGANDWQGLDMWEGIAP